jgi:protein-L-isoaspartate(D-aspartate) O-methyltransferase
MPTNPEGRALNNQMIDGLRARQNLLDRTSEAAFRAVPRHVFLPGQKMETIYTDEAIAIKRDSDGSVLSSSSQPTMMAIMLRQLRLEKGDNVLEIGTGTGYNAAIMQHIVGETGYVTSIELDNQLADQARQNLQRMNIGNNVNVVTTDGAQGYAPRASYDRIIATAATWDIPPAWIKQLKPDGVLVAPMWIEGMQVSAAFSLQDDGTLYSSRNIPCAFISMRGVASGPMVSRRVGRSTLMLSAHNVQNIDSAALHLLLSDDAEINRLTPALDSQEYWNGFVIYLALNVPSGYQFSLYNVAENQKTYGLEGSGFAITRRGTACFVPYNGEGLAYAFGGADAFMHLQKRLDEWEAAGRPGSDSLRLLVLPQDHPRATAQGSATVYQRQYHHLLVWLEG